MIDRELAGRTLSGRYDVLELLGAGGMGAVYRAHDRELDEIVALKVIRSDRASHPHMVEQFRREVKLARRVTHVNIARTFELGYAEGVVFCTMELVDGESLRSRLRREGKLSVREAATIARGLCDGLTVAHAAGVIHRDIKPDNVLLASDGRVVLADFGVATLTAVTDGALVGTLEYMAPEQARGEPPTPASDLYSVGLVLYEMLTGLRAFAGTMSELLVAKQDAERVTFDLAEIVVDEQTPPELVDIVGHATERELPRRIASARELGHRLQAWTANEPLTMPAPRDDARALATVVVLAPRAAGDESRLHVAEGVHQELLRRLARRPRLRVWPRVHAVDVQHSTLVTLEVRSELAATIQRADTSVTLNLRLDIANIGFAATAIANAVVNVVNSEPDPDDASLELLLRTRRCMHRGFGGVPAALALLQQAREVAPDDPRISAELAVLLLRYGFAGADVQGELDLAPALVAAALAQAPHLAESHVAAAYLELHTGDPVVAATEFRTAIACSPFLAEPHEGLGRMLLEAGFLADAEARIDDALAIAPNLASVRWELARAHALEQNWFVYDRLVDELMREGDRAIARMRFAVWRGDFATVAAIRAAPQPLSRSRAYEPDLVDLMFSALLDQTWSQVCERMVALAVEPTSSLRRHALRGQLVAETAGHAGDLPTCLRMLEHAVSCGLFDLHWFDRCPLIARARDTVEGRQLRAIVERRAHAIQDALFCDRTPGRDTTLSTE